MSKIINAKVDSSQILELDYNGEKQELIATFKGGTQYLYAGVDVDTYMKVVCADSVGKEFNATIKAGGFEFAKLEKVEDTVAEKVQYEHDELADKYSKLEEFLVSDTFDGLDKQAQDLLQEQASIMKHYLAILSSRLELLNK